MRLPLFVSCVALFFCSVCVADTPAVDKAIYITVSRNPGPDSATRYSLQVTSGAEFKLVDAITETLPNSDEDSIQLRPTQKLNLNFRTDKILVAKIEGKKLTIAPADTFPYSVTKALARKLESIGYSDTQLVSLDTLLELVNKDEESKRDPFGGDPFLRKYQFRSASLTAVPSPSLTP